MSDSDIAEIRDLEERRYAAMKAGDIDVLEDLLHDELAYMHSTGDLESKEGYLGGLRAGTSAYKRIDYDDQTIRVHDDLAMVFHPSCCRCRVRRERTPSRQPATGCLVPRRRQMAYDRASVRAGGQIERRQTFPRVIIANGVLTPRPRCITSCDLAIAKMRGCSSAG